MRIMEIEGIVPVVGLLTADPSAEYYNRAVKPPETRLQT